MGKQRMKTFKTLALATAVSASLLATTGVMAATQGDFGIASSQGSFDISLFNETEVRIFGLEDVSLVNPNDTPTPGDLSGNTNVCVYANVPNYTVSLASTNGFALQGGSGTEDSVRYNLDYEREGAASETWSSRPGDNRSGMFAGNFERSVDDREQQECTTGVTAIKVNISEEDYARVDTGVYTDTVTVTVAAI
ncbi:MAG: hypothetical protein ACPGEF_04585 [Endozoicomonas sp.]